MKDVLLQIPAAFSTFGCAFVILTYYGFRPLWSLRHIELVCYVSYNVESYPISLDSMNYSEQIAVSDFIASLSLLWVGQIQPDSLESIF